ncbi:MAG: dockerin type I repeat-containing protein [Clostridia bacterium]|nr:dockerin type I repeat-containing protein [Clostridia bacterium]
MKKSTKIISMILAVVMVLSTLPLMASAAAIKSEYNTVEKVISMNSIKDLLDYLVTNINNQKDILITPVLRIVFLAMNNEKINEYIGTKEVTKLSGDESSKILVKWLDTDILPPLQAKLEEAGAITFINDNVPGLKVDIHSVQATFNTLAQLDGFLLLNLLGDAQDINVKAVKGVTVAGNEQGAVKAVIQFLKDNMGLVKKALDANISLGVVNNFFDVNEKIAFLKDLPKLVKSYIYKLIDKDAAAGEFKDGAMGGDWAKSTYKDYTADQLLAAALVKLINGTDDQVSVADANKVLGMSFYDLLAEYAEPVYAKFAVDPLNKAIASLNDWLADEDTLAIVKAQFKPSVADVSTDTFSSVFAGAKDTGILGQLNNILVIALQHVLSADTFNKIGLEQGTNSDKLNSNFEKFAKYVIKLAQANEDFAKLIYVPEDILAADADSLSLSDMAYIVLKPFFSKWFRNADADVLAAADSLEDLGVVAVYYTATNTDWLNLDYTFAPLTAADLNGLDAAGAEDLTIATAAGIAIGAVKYNKDSMHFTATLDESDWKKAFIGIENWALDFVTGLPAAARVHDLRNAPANYGPFYRLNVLLNELIDFSFLNDVSSATFKFDVETLLRSGVLENLYECDLAGVIGIFEKNTKSGNVLNGQIAPSVIGIVNRILTALFEHSCGDHANKTDTTDDPKNPCTKQIKREYEYCTVCGAYFNYKETSINKSFATHKYSAWETVVVQEGLEPTLYTCTIKTQQQRTCEICGNIDKGEIATPNHKWDDPKAADPRCTVCGKSVSELKGGEPPKPTYNLGDIDNDNKITASDARLALRRAVDLEDYAEGSPEFLACDIDKDGKVTAGDARIILRIAVDLEKIEDYK